MASKAGEPTRRMALLLAVVGPWGTGHAYLGETRRALAWLLVSCAVLILSTLAIPWLGATVGYRAAVGLFFAAFALPWAASLLDLWRLFGSGRSQARWVAVVAYWVVGTLFSVALRAPVRGLIIEAFHIPSGSMLPTLLVGDHIMVDKSPLHRERLRRGEVIVFTSPEHPDQDFIKRVVALPGDRLEIRHGHPWINGQELPHCLVGAASLTAAEGGVASGELHLEFFEDGASLAFFDEHAMESASQGPYQVSEGEVWVLGDNRFNSHDSRSWFEGRGGGLPLRLVKGRALFRWLSLTQKGLDGSRFATALDEPLLPASMASLESALRACLAQRPARADAAALPR